jgi:pyrroloquinoline-quinone synthase
MPRRSSEPQVACLRKDKAAVGDHRLQHNREIGVSGYRIQALRDKCDILWAQLDALYFAYVQPGWPPPGAFRMEE